MAHDATDHPLDLAAVRARLQGTQGRRYWRSLEEVAETEGFRHLLQREFPLWASEWNDPISRRRFLHLMGASLALAGLTSCRRQPPEKIVPYVESPEQAVPGKPLFFATAVTRGGIALGTLAESHLGRPTKIEGNPDHPASLGATDVFAQASLLTLYDPDRSQVVTHLGQIASYEAFAKALTEEMERQRATGGAGMRILTETLTSPTLASQLGQLLTQFPAARWHVYQPVNRDNVWQGAQQAFGEIVQPLYHFDRAEVVLSLDADLLTSLPGSVRYARDVAERRRVRQGQAAMSRLYCVESTPTLTGALADHRLALPPSQVGEFALALARALGVASSQAGQTSAVQLPGHWIEAAAADLQRHRGSSLVLAGDHQPPLVHALTHAINEALGNAGTTVVYIEPVEVSPVVQTDSLRALVADMQAGQVDLLVMLGGNPVFSAPADLGFAEALRTVRQRIHLSLYQDETSVLCTWHVPATHELEAWSDARAHDGTVTILQPLIEPLYQGRSAHELLAAMLGQAASGEEIVRGYWQSLVSAEGFDAFWQTTLHDGVMAGTAHPERTVAVQKEWLNQLATPIQPPGPQAEGLEILFQPDPTLWDGRFANNGWLQELPKPLTKLTWDNAALISPRTAERLGLANEEEVELVYRGFRVAAPVWILPGQPDATVTVHLGYGRTQAGRVGNGTGFNAYALRPSDQPWFGSGLTLRRTGRRWPLAVTQSHHNMEGRHLVRVGTLAEFQANPNFAHELGHDPDPDHTLHHPEEHRYDGYAWGMAIDLTACIGCNACVVACQAENNIPIVGKEQVAVGREMHWIRIDRYWEGELDAPATYHQPVMCMQCENAPCEPVCPVGATVHSQEGLNDMVYNRCVGTRYCANNCPYKVRRFNFLQYSDEKTESLKLLRNPDVTVRSRGVMEKCTYCVQRINAARIEAKKEERSIRDGEVVTACQQACPTQAIVFGDLNDPHSRVSQLRREPLDYGLLTELNTRPRTRYLARLRNPNPELERE